MTANAHPQSLTKDKEFTLENICALLDKMMPKEELQNISHKQKDWQGSVKITN